jgi:N utilization substance protein A
MSKDILLVVDTVSNEKGVDKGIIFEAVELALATATKKRYREEIGVRVAIDRESGEYDTFRCWHIIDDNDEEWETPSLVISLEDAKEKQPSMNFELGDYYEESIESIGFGRIAAQTAKQVIVQKVREAERVQIIEAYRDRVGELINGSVKKATKGAFLLCAWMLLFCAPIIFCVVT